MNRQPAINRFAYLVAARVLDAIEYGMPVGCDFMRSVDDYDALVKRIHALRKEVRGTQEADWSCGADERRRLERPIEDAATAIGAALDGRR